MIDPKSVVSSYLKKIGQGQYLRKIKTELENVKVWANEQDKLLRAGMYQDEERLAKQLSEISYVIKRK